MLYLNGAHIALAWIYRTPPGCRRHTVAGRLAGSGRTFDRVRSSVPTLSTDLAEQLVAELRALQGPLGNSDQPVLYAVRETAKALGISLSDTEALGVQHAMAVPAEGWIPLLPGARELIEWADDAGLTIVLVSNTTWRDAYLYRQDFDDFGLGHCIAAVVTSVDAGHRKPHPAMFQAALAAAKCAAAEAVMIGNSEENDIMPAKSLGMRTIFVAIEAPPPMTTAADALCTSLADAQRVLRSWLF